MHILWLWLCKTCKCPVVSAPGVAKSRAPRQQKNALLPGRPPPITPADTSLKQTSVNQAVYDSKPAPKQNQKLAARCENHSLPLCSLAPKTRSAKEAGRPDRGHAELVPPSLRSEILSSTPKPPPHGFKLIQIYPGLAEPKHMGRTEPTGGAAEAHAAHHAVELHEVGPALRHEAAPLRRPALGARGGPAPAPEGHEALLAADRPGQTNGLRAPKMETLNRGGVLFFFLNHPKTGGTLDPFILRQRSTGHEAFLARCHLLRARGGAHTSDKRGMPRSGG